MPSTLSPKDLLAVKAQGFIHNRGADCFSARVLARTGQFTAEQMIRLAEAALKFGSGRVSFTTRLNVEIPGLPFESLPAFKEYIAAAGLVTGGTGRKVRPITTCKGTLCPHGLHDTFGLAEELHQRFLEAYQDVGLPQKFKIGVGGCPNSCAKPELNDVGLAGQMTPGPSAQECKACKECAAERACPDQAFQAAEGRPVIDSARCRECGVCVRACPFDALEGRFSYKIYLGGRWGREKAQGRPYGPGLSTQGEVFELIKRVIDFFRANGRPGERLATTIDRVGWTEMETFLGREGND